MSQSMIAYSLLAIAIISEVTGSTFLAKSEGFSKPLPTIITMICFGIAFYLLSQVVKIIPLGIAYAIWSGVGIVLVTIIAWIVFDQKLDVWGIIGIALIMSGVLVLNLLSKTSSH